MKPFSKDPLCPACQFGDVVEHIEAGPVEGREKKVDRRCAVDLTYLSLIEVDRRKSATDRRNQDCANMIVEHQPTRSMVCLTCAHQWYADTHCDRLDQ